MTDTLSYNEYALHSHGSTGTRRNVSKSTLNGEGRSNVNFFQNLCTVTFTFEPPSSSDDRVVTPRSHVKLLLLDYKQFLAARTIQRHVRGWLFRRYYSSRYQAAVIIQKWWRGFCVRRRRYSVVQTQLQTQIMKHYNDCATRIQALFFGWQTRRNLQDFPGIHTLRLHHAEDLLCSMAGILRKLQNDRMLPGIYDLRQSELLSKVEELTSTFGYRYYNGRVRVAITHKRSQLEELRRIFRNSFLYAEAPFPGYSSYYAPSSIATLTWHAMNESRLHQLVVEYDKAFRSRAVKKIYMKKSARLRKHMAIQRESVRSHFCKEFVERMVRVESKKRRNSSLKECIDDLLEAAEDFNCYCKAKYNPEENFI